MCRVTRTHVWKHHIPTEALMQRLGLDAVDFYVARRQLGWLGHVARMDFSRLPRRMLSCWVPRKRPPGAPRMTYGRTVGKALDVFDLDPKKWPALAADRAAWRAMLKSGDANAAFPSGDVAGSVAFAYPLWRCAAAAAARGRRKGAEARV